MTEIEQEINSFLDALKLFLETANKIKKNEESELIRVDSFLSMEQLQHYSYCIDEIRKMMNELNETKEKIKDLELRRDGWKKIIPSCFGCADGKFANHDCEKKDAERIRKIVEEENVDIELVLQEFRLFLEKEFPHNQNDGEMKLVEKFFKKV